MGTVQQRDESTPKRSEAQCPGPSAYRPPIRHSSGRSMKHPPRVSLRELVPAQAGERYEAEKTSGNFISVSLVPPPLLCDIVPVEIAVATLLQLVATCNQVAIIQLQLCCTLQRHILQAAAKLQHGRCNFTQRCN